MKSKLFLAVLFLSGAFALLLSACASREILDATGSGEGICVPSETELSMTAFVGAETAVPLRLRNTGDGPVEASIPSQVGPFRLEGAGSFVLEPDGVRTVGVVFAPPSTGSFEEEVVTLACRSITLIGEGMDPPDCSVSESALDFGTFTSGAACPERSFTLRNDGVGRLEGRVTSPCPAFVVVEGANYSLGTGEEQDVTVLWVPDRTGASSCELDVGSPFFCENVDLSGTATDRPLGQVTSDTGARLAFGPVLADGPGGDQLELGFDVRNTSTGSGLTVTPAVSSGDPSYTILGPASVTLGPGEVGSWSVRFDPANSVGVYGDRSTSITGLGGCALAVTATAQVGFDTHVDTLIGNSCRGCHNGSTAFAIGGYGSVVSLTDTANPNNSLLLRRARGESHSGGLIWTQGDSRYVTTLRWIEGGVDPR
jgi:hypothetical protein